MTSQNQASDSIKDFKGNKSPFNSFFSLNENHEKFFYGRDLLISKLLENVNNKKINLIIGPCGSGKTSLIFAGLVPNLKKKNWFIASFKPSRLPFVQLASSLIPAVKPDIKDSDKQLSIGRLATEIRQQKKSLNNISDEIKKANPDLEKVLIIIDQFEDIFTRVNQKSDAVTFIESLTEHFNNTDSFISILFAIQTESLSKIIIYPEYANLIQDSNFFITPLDVKQLNTVLEKLSSDNNFCLDEKLRKKIIEDYVNEDYNLSQLSFTLDILYKLKDDKLKVYEEIGGISQSISYYCESFFLSLTPAEQELARKIILKLIYSGINADDVCAPVQIAEIGAKYRNIIAKLINANIFEKFVDQTNSAEAIKITNRVIVQKWPTLNKWIEDDKIFRSFKDRLYEKMWAWQNKEQSNDLILKGSFLAEAISWLDKRPEDFIFSEKRYINASVVTLENEYSKQESKTKKYGYLFYIFVILALLSFVYSGWKLNKSNTNQQNASELFAQAIKIRDKSIEQKNLSEERYNLADKKIKIADDKIIQAEKIFSDAHKLVTEAKTSKKEADLKLQQAEEKVKLANEKEQKAQQEINENKEQLKIFQNQYKTLAEKYQKLKENTTNLKILQAKANSKMKQANEKIKYAEELISMAEEKNKQADIKNKNAENMQEKINQQIEITDELRKKAEEQFNKIENIQK